MEYDLDKRFPLNAKDYKLYEEVGEGVSAIVYRALCIPLNEIVAIKVLDLEKCNNDLDGIRREVQTMTLIDHPNVLRAHCSFTADHSLWVVMPYMAGGSCLHIMKSSYPEGFEEPVIATLLKETLKALVYLHAHGHIHRDVKSGNILIDSNGAVKVADFGVSACMFDAGDRQRNRNTFVGTPCWMAPEVMQQLHGYDFKADIWSFGITALELAHGHAPFSKYPPMKVLLMTLQNAPPGLDYERDRRFSKSFKEMVAACLVKDPKKRPTSEKLLKHHFFKHARSYDYLARTILDNLAPLGERFRVLKQEYIRGISAWNFNLEDLKSQAALGPMNSFFSPVSGGSMSPTTTNFTAASLFPSLQYILQQNTAQREEIIKLIKYVEETSGNASFQNCPRLPLMTSYRIAEKLYLKVSVSNAKINVADNTCFCKGEGATVSDERFATESWEPYGRIAETENEKCPARKTIECFDQ
ncbi:hypothetical protein Pint_02725 [Pistacia integerrima]|uniref:Uncharacterized protein n=1 Tax=Pistacia integerrima TaxID=434235 RepID=A0ACC0ZI47_9ROSI|nr:hypothetical protein Pint_02725 [Pistacia integerrima]